MTEKCRQLSTQRSIPASINRLPGLFRASHKVMGLYKHRQTRYHLMDMKLIHIHISKIVYYMTDICAIMHTTDTVI